MVLSGMGNMDMMNDNISFMKDFCPLNEKEMAALHKAAAIYRGEELIPCTGCRYCVDDCPQQIAIPDLFAAVNNSKNTDTPADFTGISGGKAADCVKCGKCENHCPQALPIRELLPVADRAVRPLPVRAAFTVARAFVLGRNKKGDKNEYNT